ncbi:MAG: hypothetical protein ACK5ZO_11005 [Gemmatimonas sp.]|jgi:hypothetical protein|uniref:hypothetical protein n=1 Tax=Gemmatimonas sp. TaxID=1962908 RepID=UPI00391F7415
MIGAREAFAMAERHAWWCRVTFDATVPETVRELRTWRTRYDVALSDEALTTIAEHVAYVPSEPVERAA